MARRAGPADDGEDVELNMTPMLDVVFILLIFFIVTAVFVKEPGVETEDPEVSIAEEDLRPTLLVAITRDDEIWIDRRLVRRAELQDAIRELKEQNPRAEASVRGDSGAKISLVYDVMEALYEANVEVQKVSVEPG